MKKYSQLKHFLSNNEIIGAERNLRRNSRSLWKVIGRSHLRRGENGKYHYEKDIQINQKLCSYCFSFDTKKNRNINLVKIKFRFRLLYFR